MGAKVKISVRLPQEDVTWMENECARLGPAKTNTSLEVHKAIVQRMISMMPKWKQEAIVRKVRLARENRERSLFDERKAVEHGNGGTDGGNGGEAGGSGGGGLVGAGDRSGEPGESVGS